MVTSHLGGNALRDETRSRTQRTLVFLDWYSENWVGVLVVGKSLTWSSFLLDWKCEMESLALWSTTGACRAVICLLLWWPVPQSHQGGEHCIVALRSEAGQVLGR